jgi:hypothetical protein
MRARHIIVHSTAGGIMQTWAQDFRYAWRMFRKNVLSTLIILASLAIGIGANSAIFSVVDALLLRPLPYPHPDRLAAVWLHSPAIGIFGDWASPGQYIDIQNENHSLGWRSVRAALLPWQAVNRPSWLTECERDSCVLLAQPLFPQTLHLKL